MVSFKRLSSYHNAVHGPGQAVGAGVDVPGHATSTAAGGSHATTGHGSSAPRGFCASPAAPRDAAAAFPFNTQASTGSTGSTTSGGDGDAPPRAAYVDFAGAGGSVRVPARVHTARGLRGPAPATQQQRGGMSNTEMFLSSQQQHQHPRVA